MPKTMVDHEQFIEELAGEAAPVSRPLAIAPRAVMWSGLALILGWAASRLMPTAVMDWSNPNEIWLAVNAGLSIVLGLATLAFAFAISTPGRSRRGLGWIAALLAVWMAVNIGTIVVSGSPVGHVGDGQYCFRFVALTGAPMIAVVLFALARTRALRPVQALSVAGAAIGFLSFGLLAFCHAPGMNVMDFVMHLLAASALTLVTILVGRRLVAA